jgi:hypothetical protein
VRPGVKVCVQRDETVSPAKGTWLQYRGQVGTIVEVNDDRRNPLLTEYGITFGKTRPDPETPGRFRHSGTVTWFKATEIQVLAPVGCSNGL